jgi:uncharacterized protein (DUF2336 family)
MIPHLVEIFSTSGHAMMAPADFLVELEDAVAACSPERCARILSGVVQLLAASRERPHDLLVNVVDDVLMRLTARVTASTLLRLSSALAGLSVAPRQTLQHLASHNDANVARPILLKSQAVHTADLTAIATWCGEQHQLAIASRNTIEAPVAEALIARGERTVCLALITNPGTTFSEAAYGALIEKAGQDDAITKALVLRPGIPDLVVRRLLSAPPGRKPETSPAQHAAPAQPLAAIASRLPRSADYAAARPEIVALSRIGKLNDSTVNRFVIRGETANLVTALSVLSGAPTEIIEHVMAEEDCEGLVMACRASRLNWPTTLAILSNRSGMRLTFAERERAQQMFEAQLLSTSQWTVRWGEMAANSKGAPNHRGGRTEVNG